MEVSISLGMLYLNIIELKNILIFTITSIQRCPCTRYTIRWNSNCIINQTIWRWANIRSQYRVQIRPLENTIIKLYKWRQNRYRYTRPFILLVWYRHFGTSSNLVTFQITRVEYLMLTILQGINQNYVKWCCWNNNMEECFVAICKRGYNTEETFYRDSQNTSALRFNEIVFL